MNKNSRDGAHQEANEGWQANTQRARTLKGRRKAADREEKEVCVCGRWREAVGGTVEVLEDDDVKMAAAWR